MTSRAMRRADERQILKAARKVMRQNTHQAAAEQQPQAEPQPTPEISAARLAANRANAQHSTGAKSPEGKAASSLNALKTGLTGVTVLLPCDDATAYKAHILSYENLFKPVGPEECALVQSIADIRWRLNRIPALEIALLSIGRKKMAETDTEFHRTDLNPVLEMQIRVQYEKEFRNLHLQENRLARRREKETAELRALQTERKTQEAEQLHRATNAYLVARRDKKTFDLAARGFEFSKERFIQYLAALTPSVKYEELSATPAEPMQAAA